MKSIFSGLTSLPLIFLFFLLWNSRVVKWLFLFFFKWDARVYSSRVLKSMWQNNCDERLVLLIVFWRKVLFYYSSIWRTVQRVLLYHNFTKNLNIRAANVNIFNFYIVVVFDYLETFPVWKQQELLAFLLWFLRAILMKKSLIQTLFMSIEGL